MIDASLRTSYGVRFLLRAYDMSIFLHSFWKVCSWFFTRSAEVDLRSKLYVFGKRKPSVGSLVAPKPGITCGRLAERYAFAESLTFRPWISLSAIFATAFARAAICARVKPSGKTTWNWRSC